MTALESNIWHLTPRHQPGGLRAAALATLMHGLLIMALLLHLDWRSQPPEAIQAELWANLPIEAGLPVPPPVVIEKEYIKPAPLEKPAKIKPEIALPPDKPVPKSPVKATPAELNEQKVRTQKEMLREKEQEKIRQEELQRLFGKAGATAQGTNNTSSANQSQGRNEVNFASQVRACIRPYIRMPNTLSGNPEALYRLDLLPSGEHTNVTLLKTSGQRSWDDAVDRAIRQCNPLPQPRQGLMPRSLELGFRPRDEAP